MEVSQNHLSHVQTLLIVDDDECYRRAVAFDFKRSGFRVLLASSGKEAFDLVCAEKVHVILTDVRMPGGNGIDLLAEVRQSCPDTPIVILMTAFSDISLRDAGQWGAKAVIYKPCDKKILIETVQIALNSGQN
jgi:CheY-like chemotaxis protein